MPPELALPSQQGARPPDEIASASVGYARWFCVYTEPAQEYRVFNGLAEIGMRGYLARILTEQRRYGRIEHVIRPAFPRYVMARFDPADGAWGAILHLRGARDVLRTPGGQPQQAKPGEIERLQARGRAGDGVICEGLPGMAAQQPLQIASGAEVRVIDGPFQSFAGICQWSEGQRIGVLLEMFGAKRAVQMDRAAVRVV